MTPLCYLVQREWQISSFTVQRLITFAQLFIYVDLVCVYEFCSTCVRVNTRVMHACNNIPCTWQMYTPSSSE